MGLMKSVSRNQMRWGFTSVGHIVPGYLTSGGLASDRVCNPNCTCNLGLVCIVKPSLLFQLESPEKQHTPLVLGDTSPFFPGILLFRKPSEPQGKQLVFEKNNG